MKSFVAGLLPRWPWAASSRKTKMVAADERAAGMIEMINEATAPFTGGDYFRLLVARLAEQLNVDATLVTECLDYPENHVRTLAYWHGGGFSENIEFDLAGTPCQHVIDDEQFSFYPDRLGNHFPEWSSEEGGAVSFIGIPVFAPSDGRLVGHIAVYDTQPMRPDAVVESMFRIIAARAGAEIERIQAEKALRDSEARARQHLNELAHVSRVSAMGEMASAVAHEINQPLTAIKTYLQTCIRLLDDEDTDPATIRQAMEKSLASAEHSQRIVRKLRDFMKRGEIRRRPIPAARLIRECALLLETEAHHHRVDLDYEIEEDLPMVRVDPVLIQQVLSNLTRNAIDSINDSDRTERRLVLGARLDGPDRVVFRVTDSGKGIDPSIREKLFEPFVSTRRKGMGIGLSLCQSVIENHGGEMWLDTSDDTGATFCFTVPVHERKE
jgi:signal transduction histidine kinase